MLSAFRSAFATPDLRKKILFTLGIIVVYRIGATLPSPGVSYPNVNQCLANANSNGVYALINLFSGGALLKLSIFALGIMPYITASIIIQLLTAVIPRFEQLKKEGQSGQNKLTQYTRYLTSGWPSCSPPASSRWPSAASCSGTAPTRTATRSRSFRTRQSGRCPSSLSR